MEWTRARVRLVSFLVVGAACGLVAVDAPASSLSLTAAILSFLVLVGSFARVPEGSADALSDVRKRYALTDADILSENVQDGCLVVDETRIAFVRRGEREQSWSVPLASVTRVLVERRLLDRISVRYESASGEKGEKGFTVWYDEAGSDEARKRFEAWIERVHTRAGIPLPTSGTG